MSVQSHLRFTRLDKKNIFGKLWLVKISNINSLRQSEFVNLLPINTTAFFRLLILSHRTTIPSSEKVGVSNVLSDRRYNEFKLCNYFFN
ncbi:hypothetical protein EB093_07810 [bacterium]|nr:hypothetical protein [bacterium]